MAKPNCAECGEEKIRVKGMCKKCYMKKWQKENPEKAKAATKKWQKENPKKAKAAANAANRKYYKENTEKIKALSKKWQKENSEKVKANNKKWKEENSEKVKAANKKWKKENPEKVKAATKKWQKENPKKAKAAAKAATKKWQKENPKKAKAAANAANRKWQKENPELCRLRNEFRDGLNNYAEGKKMPTNKYSISYMKILKYIGPCPGDRALYHIDHIRPLCSFNFINKDGTQNLEEIKKAFAPENHQWLLASENLSKNRQWSQEIADKYGVEYEVSI